MAEYLSVGDIVEAGPLLGGMSEEQVILQVVEEDNAVVRFEASIFGIHLGMLEASVNDTGDIIDGGFHE